MWLSNPERKRVPNLGAWDSEGPMAECLKPKPRNNEVTTRSRPETLSTNGWANRMAQFHQVFRRSTNQAVSDHKGDLEVDLSPDWKLAELVADGSWYVAELVDVQDQPSGRVQHGLKPVKEIWMRPKQETVAVILHCWILFYISVAYARWHHWKCGGYTEGCSQLSVGQLYVPVPRYLQVASTQKQNFVMLSRKL